MHTSESWTPNIKFKKELYINADSYNKFIYHLFNVKPTRVVSPNFCNKDEKFVFGDWLYCEKILPKGAKLSTIYGNKKGFVSFDNEIIIPCLHKYEKFMRRWNYDPYMSLTPLEFITLRAGIRAAKGKVIIAGLGLGYQLIEISKKPSVNNIVLIEKDAKLVEHVLPKVKLLMCKEISEVIIGDAYKVLSELSADVAVIDIFKSYGEAFWLKESLTKKCKNINKIWCWGDVNF